MLLYHSKFVSCLFLTLFCFLRLSSQCLSSGGAESGSYVATAASQQFSANPVEMIQPEVQMQAPPQEQNLNMQPFQQDQNLNMQALQQDQNFGRVAEVTTPQPYPLRECYTGDSNYMCCNMDLENVIKQTYAELSASQRLARQLAPVIVRDNRPDGSPPLLALADRLQASIEGRFNTTFEIIIGKGDFASKSRFLGNFICKVRREMRFILAYGTPKAELEPALPGPLQQNGFFSSRHRVWVWT